MKIKLFQYRKNWFVTSNMSKTKLVKFHHHRAELSFLPDMMNSWTVNDAIGFGRLLGFNFPLDLNWNSYTQSIAKNAWKFVYSLYNSRKQLTSPSMLLEESDQTDKWSMAVQSSLSKYD